MNAIQSLGRSNINIAEPQGPLLIKERKHDDLEEGHHGEGEEQLHHHHSLPPPAQHPGCAQPGGGWIMFSKHIRNFIFVLLSFSSSLSFSPSLSFSSSLSLPLSRAKHHQGCQSVYWAGVFL